MTREVLIQILNDQAADDGLWFVAESCSEAYLQAELRRLHEVVENYLKEPEQPAAKTRLAFEAWYRQEYNEAPDNFKQFVDGTYLDPSLNADWDVWQAALAQRQPLTIEQIKSMDCRATFDEHFRVVRMTEAAHGIGAKA